eukprot:37618-Prymnesium_polylepis.1
MPRQVVAARHGSPRLAAICHIPCRNTSTMRYVTICDNLQHLLLHKTSPGSRGHKGRVPLLFFGRGGPGMGREVGQLAFAHISLS